MYPVLDESFQPPRWLRNAHVQSILPSLPARRGWIGKRAAGVLAASREIVLDCGDDVRLQSFHSSPTHDGRPPGDRAAVLLHGWEGSADSLYIVSLAQQLFDRGFEVVRLNLRDHGSTHHLNRELFHSCRLPEVIGAVRRVQALLPGRPLHLIGFSLGGNFMLRVAGAAEESGLDIVRVTAVSPVLDPAETLLALEDKGFGAYHVYFVRRWMQSLLKKQAAWPHDYDFNEIAKLTNLRKMTAELVRRFTEFASVDEYLNGYAITGNALARLHLPATLITALDDPIIPARGLERLARPESLRVIVTRRGGHCGFLEDLVNPSWAERKILSELEEVGRATPAS